MAVFKFSKPVEFDGEKVESINLDLDSLTGQDMMMIERQFLSLSRENQANLMKEFSKEYQILIAARAAKLPVEFFSSIGARDFSGITIHVQNFFL